jgi:hypothetical protein
MQLNPTSREEHAMFFSMMVRINWREIITCAASIAFSVIMGILTPAMAQGPQECDPAAVVSVNQEGKWQQCINLGRLNLWLGLARFVFVTSQTFDGDLGGLDGADMKCQSVADAANLPGSYQAWIGQAGETFIRFAHSTVPYILPSGQIVAKDWNDLTRAKTALANPINVDERGNIINDHFFVWTNLGANVGEVGPIGAPPAPLNPADCNNWSSDQGSDFGWVGYSRGTDSTWTQLGIIDCKMRARLYCFESAASRRGVPRATP